MERTHISENAGEASMETIHLSYPLSQNIIANQTQPQILAIGQFDGLHLGHQSVILEAKQISNSTQLPLAVMTFYPHPKEVMKKGKYEGYLTPPALKEQILQDMGIDYLYIVDFDDAFSQVSPEAFVQGMLLPLQVHTAVVGFDFRYGYQGAGDASTLAQLSGNSLHVQTVSPFLINDEKVSSSGIRVALQEGNMGLVQQWLGRPYSVTGIVNHGEKRGRKIGYPTANLKPNEHFVLPARGVYAVKVKYNDMWLKGVMNVGVKPTFHDNIPETTLEIHLFDFAGDLYHEELLVHLVQFIRPEMKFDGVESLVAQIAQDSETAKAILA